MKRLYNVIMQQPRKANHASVPPLIDDNCRVLVLGSMLSPKSVEAKFYYAHPQNRFWSAIAGIFDSPSATTVQARTELALSHGVALWDVIESCDIVGAADSTIKNVVYNDIDGLLKRYPKIRAVFTTGGAAYKYLMRYNKTVNNDLISDAIPLPSTSPLNCKIKLPELIRAYSVIADKISEK